VNKVGVLLLTDIGSDVDDALSLLVMLNHRKINLQGIYTVNGDVDSRSRIAKHMVSLAEKEIVVARGESLPVGASVKPYSFGGCEENLVHDSFIDDARMEFEGSFDILYKSLQDSGIEPSGVEHLANNLSKSKHTVFSIGPLTNIAKLIEERPEAVTNIDRLYIMGFRLNGDMEHNIRFDSDAANIVMDSLIPITVVPGDVCQGYRMPFHVHEQLKGNPTAKYVREMLLGYVGTKLILHHSRAWSTRKAIEQSTMSRSSINEIGREKYEEVQAFKNRFFDNFTSDDAIFVPEQFWRGYYKLVEIFADPKYGHKHGEEISLELKSLVPKDVSVSDVYVPFCHLHPEALTTEKMTLSCSFDGRTLIGEGRKHDVVTNIDYTKFETFLLEYLR